MLHAYKVKITYVSASALSVHIMYEQYILQFWILPGIFALEYLNLAALDFDSEFTALGASLDLSGLAQGKFVLGNKPGRVDKIVAMVKSVQEAGRITRAQAAEIQGHLNFASGFYMSRSLKFVLNKFGEAAQQVGIWRSHLSELCELTIILLTPMPPREFTAEAMKAPHLVFTDGAWEQGEATAGLFVYDAEQNRIFTQAIMVPDVLIDIWKQEAGEQLICQIELFAFLVRFCYADKMHNRAVIAWIDNEAARFAASKGTAASPSLAAMTRVRQVLEGTKPSLIWTERIASFSNPADDPSRQRGAQSGQELSWGNLWK